MPPAAEAPSSLAPAGRTTAALGAAVALVAFALYAATLAPSVTLVDSGELIVAAHGLGVAHPPGFPLYTLLVHLATRVPWASVAERANAASALFAALAAGLLVLAFREATLRRREERATPRWSWIDLVPAAVAGLLLAFSRTLWAYATVAEVYSLNTLLVVAILLLVLRWRRAPERDRPLLAAAVLFGLALGVHHVTVALFAPALVWLVARTAGAGFFRSRRFAAAAGIAIAAAVLVYLTLPWAASRAQGLNWGDPRDLSRLLDHVSGRQYQTFLAPTADSIRTELGDRVAGLARELGPAWLPLALLLAVLGARALWRDDRPLFGALALAFLVNSGFALVYTIAEDKDAYALPAIVALVLAAAFGARAALAALPESRRRLAAGLLMLIPATALAAAWRERDRSEEWIARDFAEDTLAWVEAGGLLLTHEWQLYSPLLYLQEVERLRPDVVAVDVHLLRRVWYFDFLERRAPALLAAARPAANLYLEDLRAWTADPALYERDRALNRRINERFHAFVLELVTRHLERAPVYVTRDVALPPFSPDPELPPLLASRWDLAPRGLAFELKADRSFVDPGRPAFRMRGLFDRDRPVDPKGVIEGKVRPVYLTMITSRGFYLAGHGRTAEARLAFEEALTLDPGFSPARQALASLSAP